MSASALLFRPSVADAVDALPSSAPPPATAPPTKAAPHFYIGDYTIDGNTVLPAGAIERAVYPFLGPDKTVDDVEAARKALEKVYHDEGYATVFVDIPEQDVVGGAVRLRVTEGRIDRVRTAGAHYYLPSRVSRKLPALAPGVVPYLPAVQEQMNALNRIGAARQVTPVFRAGDKPGAVDVDLKIKDESPLHAGIDLNNRYGANTHHGRIGLMLRYDNLWQREHSLTLNYQTVPVVEKETEEGWHRYNPFSRLTTSNEVKVYSATYLLRPEEGTDMTALYAVRSRSNVAVVDQYQVIGNGTIYGVRHIVPLTAGAHTFQSLSFGVDYKHFGESLAVQGADTTQTPIVYIPFSISHTVAFGGAKSQTQLTNGINFSVRGLSDRRIDCFGQPDVDQFDCKRIFAKSNYIYLKSEYQYTYRFTFSSIVARLAWQWANQPLISNEQFSAGGADSVRAYLESERLGDNGVTAGLEYQSRSFAPARWKQVQDAHWIAFFEGASLRVKQALPGQQSHFDIAGAGVGLRMNVARYTNIDLDWAYALKDGASTQAGDRRLYFRIAAEF